MAMEAAELLLEITLLVVLVVLDGQVDLVVEEMAEMQEELAVAELMAAAAAAAVLLVVELVQLLLHQEQQVTVL
jgi:hypothetical protein